MKAGDLTEKENILKSPVTKLNGVGPVRAALYAKKGIMTLEDVLNDYPRAYENRGKTELLDDITDPDIKLTDRIIKKSEKNNFYAAMDIADIWLTRAKNGKI